MVLLVFIAFFVYLIFWAYNFYVVLKGDMPGVKVMFSDNLGVAVANNVFFLLCWFGTILGIIIGCSTISSERMGNALNTLTAKPVYRDTIINGKILGSMWFLATVTITMIALYTAIIFILCGSSLAPYLYDYFDRLPFVFLFVMVFILVFLSLSMFFSLLVRDQAFAMILSTLSVYISYHFSTTVSNNLINIFQDSIISELLGSYSPYTLMWDGGLQKKFMDIHLGAVDAFITVLPDFVRLLVIIIVIMAVNYVIFLRRDLS